MPNEQHPSDPPRPDDDITGPLPIHGQQGPVDRPTTDQTRSFQMPGRGGQPASGPQHSPWANPAAGPGYPAYVSSPGHTSGDSASFGAPAATRERRKAPWIAVPAAALLAAGLASGTTYALTDKGTSSTSSTTQVVQANPADYKDSSGVNWAATATKVTDSVVSITVGSSGSGAEGSGVILDTQGNIVTNNHVATAAGANATITVTLTNNLTYTAKVVGTDPATDLAVIRLDKPPSGLKPVTLGDDATLVVGQPVMAIGNPLGLSSTVTTGIVSALNRPVTAGESSSANSSTSTTNAIQTSAAINPGNSGGALVNASGQLIGINSSIATLGGSSASSQSGNIGIGFAIPVSVVKSITGQLISKGSVTHAQLGVKASTGSVQVGDATETAAKIAEVVPGSAAATAGVKVGDAIIAADGRQIVSSEALVGYVRAKTVGDKVVLTIVRDGKEMKLTVALGKAS